MPYPNEHAARLKDPSGFVDGSFRRKQVKQGIAVIVGKEKNGDGSMVAQAYRFNIRYFSASDAREWLKEHDIQYSSFEPAKERETEKNNDDNSDEIRVQNELKEEFRYITDKQYLHRTVFTGEDKQVYVEGMGIVYNSKTEIYPGIFESILPGAFSESLSTFRTIKSFINHKPSEILSTTRSDPALEILDGDDFLEFSSPIPPTTYGDDLIINLQRGNINGASFSFCITENGDHYKKLPDGSLHRTIIEAEIYEVGPVTNPAYEQTNVNLRNKEFFDSLKKSIETKNHKNIDNTELRIIQEFLSKRKGQ